MRILIMAIFFSVVFSYQAFCEDDPMKVVGTQMDIAEGNLRVALSKPAHGTFPLEMLSCESKYSSLMRVLAFEQRFPGYLEGKHGASTWDQYKAVRELFEELRQDDSFEPSRKLDPEASMRIILNKPATGSFPWNLRTCDARAKSLKRLIAYEQKSPGFLKGKAGDQDSRESKAIHSLFQELQKHEAFDLNRQQDEKELPIPQAPAARTKRAS